MRVQLQQLARLARERREEVRAVGAAVRAERLHLAEQLVELCGHHGTLQHVQLLDALLPVD